MNVWSQPDFWQEAIRAWKLKQLIEQHWLKWWLRYCPQGDENESTTLDR